MVHTEGRSTNSELPTRNCLHNVGCQIERRGIAYRLNSEALVYGSIGRFHLEIL